MVAKMAATQPIGTIEMCAGPFQALAALPEQPRLMGAADGSLVACVASRVSHPVEPGPRRRLGSPILGAAADKLQMRQRLISVSHRHRRGPLGPVP
jgi:hypothetical protein